MCCQALYKERCAARHSMRNGVLPGILHGVMWFQALYTGGVLPGTLHGVMWCQALYTGGVLTGTLHGMVCYLALYTEWCAVRHFKQSCLLPSTLNEVVCCSFFCSFLVSVVTIT